ncbi:TPA: hypothetical protein RSV79_002560, partial [Mannheimia haemolytica]|nr:hypothetical protein [Mannheimia haemolytica]HDL3957255.1 hypothetical protein [Mannheimia haemolytica]HDL4201535.1 hypothetical protein [Mannheimia haemolytica]HDL4237982.1 hypothetical protein [Mannheimia haemolytica]HDL4240522.1 hypothetical protein [Mannheimia haemolytica]
MKDILLDFDDTSCYLGDWEEILEEYNDRVRVEDFWHYAKEFETVPHLGNLYQEHVILKLIARFCIELDIDQDSGLVEFDYYINAIDTHFYINSQRICDIDDWNEMLDKIREEMTPAKL